MRQLTQYHPLRVRAINDHAIEFRNVHGRFPRWERGAIAAYRQSCGWYKRWRRVCGQ